MYAKFAVLLLLALELVSGQSIYYRQQTSSKRGGELNNTLSDVKYFDKLCLNFQHCTSGNQFGVLTIGVLEDKSFGPHIPMSKEDCKTFMTKLDKNDFNVATPKQVGKKTIHTEVKLLGELTKMSAWPNKKNAVDIYLFTYFSPCIECATAIVEKIKDLKNLNEPIKLHLSWQIYYHNVEKKEWTTQAEDFFRSLKILFALDNTQLVLHWATDNERCGAYVRKTYQYSFYTCLERHMTKFKGCRKQAELKKDLARFVNTLTATCIGDMDTYGQELDKCIDRFLINFKNVDKAIVRGCKPTDTRKIQPGPPLLPRDPRVGSQSLKDLSASNDKFCFDKMSDS